MESIEVDFNSRIQDNLVPISLADVGRRTLQDGQIVKIFDVDGNVALGVIRETDACIAVAIDWSSMNQWSYH